jgi:hypothetical protein
MHDGGGGGGGGRKREQGEDRKKKESYVIFFPTFHRGVGGGQRPGARSCEYNIYFSMYIHIIYIYNVLLYII